MNKVDQDVFAPRQFSSVAYQELPMMDNTLPPLGIDVSKLTLDVRLLSQHRPGPPRRFANSADGQSLLEQWLESQGTSRVHACLEATGTYSDAIATFLFEHGHQVSIINPARVTAFRVSEGIRTKTDRHDALVLARFCEQKRPALWRPTPLEIQRLQGLLGRLDDLQLTMQQERNRFENLRLDAQLRQDIQAHLSWLQQQREHTLQCACTHVQQHPLLQRACDHLDSIPGIACLTAMRLYSVYFDQQRFSCAAKLVAYAGLCPAQRLSGTSVHGKSSISMAGNAQVRKWLYMSALSVLRYDSDFAQWAGELKARGKCGRVIVVALMRKLLHVVSGILKSEQDYDPHKAFPTHDCSPDSQQEHTV
jgi:transposase